MVTHPAVQDITWCSEVVWKPLGFVFWGKEQITLIFCRQRRRFGRLLGHA